MTSLTSVAFETYVHTIWYNSTSHKSLLVVHFLVTYYNYAVIKVNSSVDDILENRGRN